MAAAKLRANRFNLQVRLARALGEGMLWRMASGESRSRGGLFIELRLREALNAVLMMSPSILLLGCGGPGPGIEDDPDFVPVVCRDGKPQFTEGLAPALPAESIELVSDQSGGQGFTFGSCQDRVCTMSLEVVQGGQTRTLTAREQVVEFLGEIDTPAEAILIAQLESFEVQCGRGGTRPASSGFDVQAHRFVGCDGRDRFLLHVDPAGELTQVSQVTEKRADSNCVVGRRPRGLCPPRREQNQRSSAGYLARAAELEAASVPAFEQLGEELARLGAPKFLCWRAYAAAQDERRHARVVSRLARRYGAEPELRRVQPRAPLSVEQLALENAQEGCVREAFGALVGAWQALHATDPRVRAAYAVIAKEEARHAALSFRVARWADTQLSAAQRRRVARAQRAAIAQLYRMIEASPSSAVQRDLGVPNAEQARRLADELGQRLWS